MGALEKCQKENKQILEQKTKIKVIYMKRKLHFSLHAILLIFRSLLLVRDKKKGNNYCVQNDFKAFDVEISFP